MTYTPSTEQVRRYWLYGANAWRDEVAHDEDENGAGAEFDSWLSTIKSQAWTEGYNNAKLEEENERS